MTSSLSRGLRILALLNQHESCTVADFSSVLRIPRATTNRILISLVREGYILRHPSDHRFRLTLKAKSLSDGMSDEQYVASLARPFLAIVTERLRWPVSFGALSRTNLIIRENTDSESPLSTDKFNIGYKMSINTTATGLCILAHLSRESRKELLDALNADGAGWGLSGPEEAELAKELRTIRSRGFATYSRRTRRLDTTSIAVPIMDDEARVRGAVTIRYAKKALPLAAAVSSFVPILKDASEHITESLRANAR